MKKRLRKSFKFFVSSFVFGIWILLIISKLNYSITTLIANVVIIEFVLSFVLLVFHFVMYVLEIGAEVEELKSK